MSHQLLSTFSCIFGISLLLPGCFKTSNSGEKKSKSVEIIAEQKGDQLQGQQPESNASDPEPVATLQASAPSIPAVNPLPSVTLDTPVSTLVQDSFNDSRVGMVPIILTATPVLIPIVQVSPVLVPISAPTQISILSVSPVPSLTPIVLSSSLVLSNPERVSQPILVMPSVVTTPIMGPLQSPTVQASTYPVSVVHPLSEDQEALTVTPTVDSTPVASPSDVATPSSDPSAIVGIVIDEVSPTASPIVSSTPTTVIASPSGTLTEGGDLGLTIAATPSNYPGYYSIFGHCDRSEIIKVSFTSTGGGWGYTFVPCVDHKWVYHEIYQGTYDFTIEQGSERAQMYFDGSQITSSEGMADCAPGNYSWGAMITSEFTGSPSCHRFAQCTNGRIYVIADWVASMSECGGTP